MKVLRLLLLSSHRMLYIRSRCLVWFVLGVFVPGLIAAYWVLAIEQNPALAKTVGITEIVTYYIAITVLSALIVSHTKGTITYEDVQKGGLSRSLLRPYSYYQYNLLFHELPYRVLQGLYGFIMIGILSFFIPHLLRFTTDPFALFTTSISIVMAFFICFNLEMIVGLAALWIYEMKLINNAYEVVLIFLSGTNVPLALMPQFVQGIAYATPFPSILSTPTRLLIGSLHPSDALPYLLMQLGWLAVTALLYALIWKFGIRRFVAAGI